MYDLLVHGSGFSCAVRDGLVKFTTDILILLTEHDAAHPRRGTAELWSDDNYNEPQMGNAGITVGH